MSKKSFYEQMKERRQKIFDTEMEIMEIFHNIWKDRGLSYENSERAYESESVYFKCENFDRLDQGLTMSTKISLTMNKNAGFSDRCTFDLTLFFHKDNGSVKPWIKGRYINDLHLREISLWSYAKCQKIYPDLKTAMKKVNDWMNDFYEFAAKEEKIDKFQSV